MDESKHEIKHKLSWETCKDIPEPEYLASVIAESIVNQLAAQSSSQSVSSIRNAHYIAFKRCFSFYPKTFDEYLRKLKCVADEIVDEVVFKLTNVEHNFLHLRAHSVVEEIFCRIRTNWKCRTIADQLKNLKGSTYENKDLDETSKRFSDECFVVEKTIHSQRPSCADFVKNEHTAVREQSNPHSRNNARKKTVSVSSTIDDKSCTASSGSDYKRLDSSAKTSCFSRSDSKSTECTESDMNGNTSCVYSTYHRTESSTSSLSESERDTNNVANSSNKLKLFSLSEQRKEEYQSTPDALSLQPFNNTNFQHSSALPYSNSDKTSQYSIVYYPVYVRNVDGSAQPLRVMNYRPSFASHK